ncbi:hypothetical protein LIER_13675 [Lithospermum erythrorhizon]|uniref:Uncharacterized protein n=1 Tax=Lithospermum erythrorhizon TaxID=34254 RepID=A0AAV3PYJ9_LITER
MSTTPSSALRLPNFNTPLFSPPPHHLKLHAPPNLSLTIPRASSPPPDNGPQTDTETQSSTSDPDNFDSRLSQVRLRYKSGTGKKAEARKIKKGKKETTGAGVFLPPVALAEPVSEGLNVEFGFSHYSERVNGRIALLGLTALVLVELATGKGVINYHTPAIVFIQVYFMAAVSALYLKYEKEKVSVWPTSRADK